MTQEIEKIIEELEEEINIAFEILDSNGRGIEDVKKWLRQKLTEVHNVALDKVKEALGEGDVAKLASESREIYTAFNDGYNEHRKFALEEIDKLKI